MSLAIDPSLRDLENCGCADETTRTPQEVYNRPGLSAVAYRVGAHPHFLQTMLADLSSSEETRRPLRELTTRDSDDFSIALLDAWATVADVLTFYQERIANESYLRTATERLSVRHLARLLGYQLKPGVAADAYLAFTVDANPGSAEIVAGTRLQSLPVEGQLPQTFETTTTITARADWNAIKPLLVQTHPLATTLQSVTVRGQPTGIQPGDFLLIVAGAAQGDRSVKRISAVKFDAARQTTTLQLTTATPPPLPYVKPTLQQAAYTAAPLAFTGATLQSGLLGKSWSYADFHAQAITQGWSLAAAQSHIATVKTQPLSPPDQGVFVFRRRAAVFGHNAPEYASLPANLRRPSWIEVRNDQGGFSHYEKVNPPYPNSWESRTVADDAGSDNHIDLDNTYPTILPESWLLLSGPGEQETYRVAAYTELSRTGYTLSAKVSRLLLESGDKLSSFTIRNTSVYAQSDALQLAALSIVEDVSGNSILLDNFYPDLQPGRWVIVTGERADMEGVVASEVMWVDEVLLTDGYSELIFSASLEHAYVRASVTLNANVAPATHGESHEEVLGSGDGSQAGQRFTLKHNPLTYTSAATASGIQSTLEVRVDGVLWREAPHFIDLGPNDRAYVVRQNGDGDAAKTTIIFGDGVHGSRLPSGQENVRARYRSGIGAGGNVGADLISLIAKRPPSVRSVGNPLPASGGAEPEQRDDARQNAPLTVLTLDRIVSLQDYADFARAFAGIAKADAVWTWTGQTRGIFVTVAGEDGAAVSTERIDELIHAMREAGDPFAPLSIASFRPVPFQVEASIKVHPDYLTDDVLAAVEAALRAEFSFSVRSFGGTPLGAVAQSDVVAAMQRVPGVVAITITALFRTGDPPAVATMLSAAAPQAGATALLAAELLMLDPRPVKLGVMP